MGIAAAVLRNLYARGKNRKVILPMSVPRHLETVLEGSNHDWGGASHPLYCR